MSESNQPQRPPARRHPSAGNLGARPALVAEIPEPEPVPGVAYPAGAEDESPLALGPGLDAELAQRLFGSVAGRRILLLGVGSGRLGIALAKDGAKVIAVDSSIERVQDARDLADLAETKVEFHQSDLADLAFIRGDQIDLALAVYSLAEVDDLSRVFRQVNRVLRSEATFILSLPHPLALLTHGDPTSTTLTRSFFDDSTLAWSLDGEDGVVYPHQLGEVVTLLWRSNFRVDTVLEPAPARRGSVAARIPNTVILRSRKQGV